MCIAQTYKYTIIESHHIYHVTEQTKYGGGKISTLTAVSDSLYLQFYIVGKKYYLS